jgi:hypothetical protein
MVLGAAPLSEVFPGPSLQDPQQEATAALLGSQIDEVFASYGPAVDATTSNAHIAYRFGTGETALEVFVQDDTVVHVRNAAPPPAIRPAPPAGIWIGMRARAALRVLGNPDHVVVGTGPMLELVFADGTRVSLQEGRVVGTRKH